MKLKLLAISFIVALTAGIVSNWVSIKVSWLANNSKGDAVSNLTEEAQIETDVENQTVTWQVPQGVTISPNSTYLENRPQEISVTFPFFPKSGDLEILLDENILVAPGDDLIIRDNSFVYPLPATASSGVYTINYNGCPDSSGEGCISGTYGFAVK